MPGKQGQVDLNYIIMSTIYLCKYAIKSKCTRINKNLKVSRDRSFTATKSKETRNKILAQENTKDSGMR